jgi:hypothetical protein
MAVYKLLVEKKKKIPRDILLSLLELAAYNAEVIQIFLYSLSVFRTRRCDYLFHGSGSLIRVTDPGLRILNYY